MKTRAFILLTMLSSLLLCGCNDEQKLNLLCNGNYLISGEVSDNEIFIEGNMTNFENVLNTDLSFVVFFSQANCDPCRRFNPIINDYAKDSHVLVVNIDLNKNKDVVDEYGKMFYPTDEDGQFEPFSPLCAIVNGNGSVNKVDNSQYMQTSGAFSHYMNSKYKASKIGYFDGEITTKSWINREFTHINFKSDDIYKNLIRNKLITTTKTVIITPNELYQSLSIIGRNKNGEFYINKVQTIDETITEEIINEYL